MSHTEPQGKPKGAGKSSFELIDAHKLAEVLPVKPGMTVLDLACGKGAYTLFISEKTGEQGLVYAVDLWKDGLILLQERIDEKNITNIHPIHADAAKDTGIDDHSVDVCLMATVFHDFHEAGQTEPVMNRIKTLLRPYGELAVIEFKKIEGPPGPPVHIRLSENEVEEMITPYGFKKVTEMDIGPYNYITVFKSTS